MVFSVETGLRQCDARLNINAFYKSNIDSTNTYSIITCYVCLVLFATAGIGYGILTPTRCMLITPLFCYPAIKILNILQEAKIWPASNLDRSLSSLDWERPLNKDQTIKLFGFASKIRGPIQPSLLQKIWVMEKYPEKGAEWRDGVDLDAAFLRSWDNACKGNFVQWLQSERIQRLFKQNPCIPYALYDSLPATHRVKQAMQKSFFRTHAQFIFYDAYHTSNSFERQPHQTLKGLIIKYPNVAAFKDELAAKTFRKGLVIESIRDVMEAYRITQSELLRTRISEWLHRFVKNLPNVTPADDNYLYHQLAPFLIETGFATNDQIGAIYDHLHQHWDQIPGSVRHHYARLAFEVTKRMAARHLSVDHEVFWQRILEYTRHMDLKSMVWNDDELPAELQPGSGV